MLPDGSEDPAPPDRAEQPTPAIEPAARPAYPAPAALPTQEGPRGLRFDFNLGCRVAVPEGRWHVRLLDLDTGNILYDTETGSALVSSTKRYYVRFRIEATDPDGSVFEHDF